jgi:hypothetical protein
LRIFTCGFEENADLVGAINILVRGHRVAACGALNEAGTHRSDSGSNRMSAVGISGLQAGDDVKELLELLFSCVPVLTLSCSTNKFEDFGLRPNPQNPVTHYVPPAGVQKTITPQGIAGYDSTRST